MLWYLDRFVGALLGPLFGLTMGLYVLGLGVVNAVGSLGLFTYNFARRAAHNSYHFLKQLVKNMSDMLKVIAKCLIAGALAFPNPVSMLVFFLAAVASVVFFTAKTIFNLVGQIFDLAITALDFAVDCIGSLVATAVAAAILPIIGLIAGLVEGVESAFRNIFMSSKDDNQPPPPPPPGGGDDGFDPDAAVAAIERAYQRRAPRMQPPLVNVNDYLRAGLQNLPVQRAMSAYDHNSALGDAIVGLRDTNEHLQRKAAIEALPENSPVKAAYEQIQEKYSCAYTLDNVFDLTQPVTVEYRMGGNLHTRVFEASAFQQMLHGKIDGYAFEPTSRTPLTGAGIEWRAGCLNEWDAHGQEVLVNPIQREGLQGGGMRIYKGLPNVIKRELEAAANVVPLVVNNEQDENRLQYQASM